MLRARWLASRGELLGAGVGFGLPRPRLRCSRPHGAACRDPSACCPKRVGFEASRVAGLRRSSSSRRSSAIAGLLRASSAERLASRGAVRVLVRDLLDELSTMNAIEVASVLILSVVVWSVLGGVGTSCVLVARHQRLDSEDSVRDCGDESRRGNPKLARLRRYLPVARRCSVWLRIAPDRLLVALLMQLIWFVPTTIVGGGLALREAHADTLRRRRHRASTSKLWPDRSNFVLSNGAPCVVLSCGIMRMVR